MPGAVASVQTFLSDLTALEPQGWNRSNYGARHRRRPDLSPESEFVVP